MAAFAQAPHADGSEHLIINALRQAGQLSLSLVAEREGTLLGQVTVSPVTISNGAAHWFGLGPVAVLPKYQGQGIGSSLIQVALRQLRSGGAAGCVVLGEPSYYGRFGFRADSRLIYPAAPPEYFQLLAFAPAVPQGIVSYQQAFTVPG